MNTTTYNRQSEQAREFDTINQKVLGDGGAHVLPMGDLRDATGFLRSGVWARQNTQSELKKRNLGYSPKPLPHRQQENVLVYDLDTPWGRKLSS